MGTVGVVAQATAGSPPNAVSIATAVNNAGGNTDDAAWVIGGAGCAGAAGDMHSIAQTGTSSSWSSVDSGSTSQFTHSAPVDAIQDFEGCSTVDLIRIKGYIRALNATSFAWNCSVESSSLSNSCSVSMGTNSTSQDCTGTTYGNDANVCTFTFGGGRGGLTGPAAGDELKLLIRATATNANGSTVAAPKVRIVYDYVS